MYRVSDELLNAIKNNTARALISFDLVSGSVSDITNDEIATLSIERASVSGKALEIGAARAFEMTLRLNAAENFKGVRFEGAEARVRIGYTTSQGVEYIPLGVFTIDGSEKQSGEIELAALDRMVKFDRDADFSSIVFPISVESLALRACYACGIDTSRLNLSDLPNASYSVEQAPGACTWRRVLMWCLEIMGVCAYIDAEGYIVAKWYEDTGEKLTASDRFDHKIHENDVVVRGVQIIDEEETAHLAGEASGFVFTIEGNELLTHDHGAVASNLAAVLVGFRHRPFEAEALPHPHLFPLDMLTYIDEDGEEVAVCVSGCVFTMNDNTELTGAGESETTSGYASLDPMTERERAIVAAALKKQEAAIIEKTGGIFEQKAEALTRMNEVVTNALGLYVITYTEADGSTQTYFCNKPTLAASSLIYVFNAGGFAWTDAWGGSNAATVWKYGITRDANAVLNYLTAERLTADHIDVGSLAVSGDFATVAKDDNGNVITSVKVSIAGIEIVSPNFSLATDGTIISTGGTIGGFSISEYALSAASNDGDDVVYVGTDEIYTTCRLNENTDYDDGTTVMSLSATSTSSKSGQIARAGLKNGRFYLENSYITQSIEWKEGERFGVFANYYYPLIELNRDGSYLTIYIYDGHATFDDRNSDWITEIRMSAGTIEELAVDIKAGNNIIPL